MDAVRRLLVAVDASGESREALRFACELAREHGAALTVLSVALLEDERRGCCDTRTVLWNRMQREVAEEDLEAARERVDAGDAVEFVAAAGDDLAAVIAREAGARACDAIVVPARRGLLRRRNPLEAVLRASTSMRVLTTRDVADLIA